MQTVGLILWDNIEYASFCLAQVYTKDRQKYGDKHKIAGICLVRL